MKCTLNMTVCSVTAYAVGFTGLQTLNRDPGSVVDIATAYGLDGPGWNAGGEEVFRTCPYRP